jgi:PAS domain-containing protein
MQHKMPSQHQNEIAIDLIYEAAVDPTRLPLALDALCQATNSVCATYFNWDVTRDRLGTFVSGSEYSGDEQYRAYYNTLDPRRPLTEALPAGGILRCHEKLGDDFVSKNEFYQDFSLKHGRRWLMSCHLTKTDTTSLRAVLHRTSTQGHFSASDAAQFGEFVPHLRRAAQMQDRMIASEAALRHSELAWNLLPFAMAMIGAGGRVHAINRSAEDIIGTNDGLVIRQGNLAATEPEAATALMAAFREATDPKAGRRGTTLMIARASGHEAYRVVVAPLPEAYRGGSGPSAIVLITDPTNLLVPAASQLVSLFQMTSAEANVALALCRGERVEDIAEERQVSVGTVRC